MDVSRDSKSSLFIANRPVTLWFSHLRHSPKRLTCSFRGPLETDHLRGPILDNYPTLAASEHPKSACARRAWLPRGGPCVSFCFRSKSSIHVVPPKNTFVFLETPGFQIERFTDTCRLKAHGNHIFPRVLMDIARFLRILGEILASSVSTEHHNAAHRSFPMVTGQASPLHFLSTASPNQN